MIDFDRLGRALLFGLGVLGAFTVIGLYIALGVYIGYLFGNEAYGAMFLFGGLIVFAVIAFYVMDN